MKIISKSKQSVVINRVASRKEEGGESMRSDYENRQNEFDKKIENQNRQISGLIVNIAVSMAVTILVYFLLTD